MNRYRHEYKYRIDAVHEALLHVRAASLLARDPHADPYGSYTVRSLYFDDDRDSALADNLAGTDPRSKYRIRYYNADTEFISLEKKTKRRGMCLKEACRISQSECISLLNGEIPAGAGSRGELKELLFTEMRQRGLKPRVIVTYERVPFVYPGGNVRVTFDRRLTSSGQIERFLDGDYAARPVMPDGESILEIKWDEVMPGFIGRGLSLEELTWTAFSKYAACRKLHL